MAPLLPQSLSLHVPSLSVFHNPTKCSHGVVLCKMRAGLGNSSSSFPSSSSTTRLWCDYDGNRRLWSTCRRNDSPSACKAEAEDNMGNEEGFELDDKALERKILESEELQLDNIADKVLQDADSQLLLKDFAAAAERVAKAKQELEFINKQERELARELLVENETTAAALVAETERDVLAAEEEMKAAELALVTARAGVSAGNLSTSKWENEDINEDLERIESAKAASVSALAGTLASIPFLLTSGDELGIGSLLSIGGVTLSCALFGVTYRYILRRDLRNIKLKSGAAAAFALVRGIGQVDVIQLQVGFPAQGASEVLLSVLNASQGLLVFGFAVLALDYCIREEILRPFPSNKSGSW